jgi:hypothetical protein
MRIGRGNRSTRRKPSPVPFRPPQIPHDLTRGGKSATNHLSYGTAHQQQLFLYDSYLHMLTVFVP